MFFLFYECYSKFYRQCLCYLHCFFLLQKITMNSIGYVKNLIYIIHYLHQDFFFFRKKQWIQHKILFDLSWSWTTERINIRWAIMFLKYPKKQHTLIVKYLIKCYSTSLHNAPNVKASKAMFRSRLFQSCCQIVHFRERFQSYSSGKTGTV